MAGLSIDTVNYFYSSVQHIFTNIVVAIIILLIGFILGRMAGKIILKVLKEIELNRILEKTAGIKVSVTEFISKFVTYLIYFIFIIAALEKINISSVIFNLLAGAVLVIIIISVFLGIKDFVPNMIAGIFIAQKKVISVGDKIRVDGIEGKILQVQLTMTKIETKRGDILFIPNSKFIKSQVIKIAKKGAKPKK